jgi:cell division protein FtsQ
VRRLPAADPMAGPSGRDRGQQRAEPTRSRGRRASAARAVFFGGIILAILAGAAWALLGSSLLVVRHVVVAGTRQVPAAQIRTAAGIRVGQPLARVDTSAAARRVERIPAVLSATVSRSWPDAIVITVRERTPQLAVSAGGGYDLIDSHGVTVRWAQHKPSGMPLLTAPPAILRGNGGVLAAALVLRQLPTELRARIVSVSAHSATDVTLHLTGDVTVLWGGVGHTAQKWAELQLLLKTHARAYDVSDPAVAVTQG